MTFTPLSFSSWVTLVFNASVYPLSRQFTRVITLQSLSFRFAAILGFVNSDHVQVWPDLRYLAASRSLPFIGFEGRREEFCSEIFQAGRFLVDVKVELRLKDSENT
jgi:hypothetical protein